MSDADYSPHETWCDTQNNISQRCNCMVSTYIEIIEEVQKENEELRQGLKERDNFIEVRGKHVVQLADENAALRDQLKYCNCPHCDKHRGLD